MRLLAPLANLAQALLLLVICANRMLLGALTLGQAAIAASAIYTALPYVPIPATLQLQSTVTCAIVVIPVSAEVGVSTYPVHVDVPSNLLIAANNRRTTVATPLAINGSLLNVADASTFPTSGALTLDLPMLSARTSTSSEIVYYNGKAGNALALSERGADGTIAKAWIVGESVEMRHIAHHHNLIASTLIAVETEVDTKADIGHTHDTDGISDNAITFAKMQQIESSRLLGRSTAGTGDIEQVSIGNGLSLVAGTLQSGAGIVIDVTSAPYNALGDGRELLDGMSDSTTTFISASANFTEADIGKIIIIDRVGASGFAPATRSPLATTIVGVTDSTTITLAASAQAALTELRFVYGSDDTAAIQSAFNDLGGFGGNAVSFPGGRIFFTSSALTIQRYALDGEDYGGGKYGSIHVVGYGATIICAADTNFIQVSPESVSAIYHVPIIEGLNFEGIGGVSQTAISLSYTFDAVIRDICIRRIGVGIDLRGALQARVQNVMVDYYTKYGFWLHNTADNVMPCNATVIDGARCRAATAGISSYRLENCDQCELRNIISESFSTTIAAAVWIEVSLLTDYAHVNRISNLYAEVETYTNSVIRVINNGSTMIDHVRRFPAPGAPLISAEGSAASSITVRDYIATSAPISAVNSWITFKQNASNTVGWLFENMGEFITGEARDLTTAAFWTNGTIPNKVTHIEPGRVTTRNV
jgi:hypothetical protein